ncbi:MAG: bacterial transcriptional activator domain-containing protein [Anaerolineaceae bacterium]|nr:bacterial transcriptional activator domain-containing protein [Anaerolineaceae bacterium]
MADNPLTALFEESSELEHKGEYSQAINRIQDALEFIENNKLPDSDKARSLVRIGWLEFLLGHYREAYEISETGLKLADPKSETTYLGMINIAAIKAETNDLAGSEKVYTSAIELCRELGRGDLLWRGLHGAAVGVYFPRGQFDLALSFEREALLLAKREPTHKPIWKFLNTMGWVHWMSGNSYELQEILERLQYEVLPDTPSEGYYLVLRAQATLDAHYDPNMVLSILTHARVIGEMRGDPGLITLVRVSLARYYIRMQKPAPALDWAEMAVEFARKIGYMHMLGISLYVQAYALWLAADLKKAEEVLHEAIDVTTNLDARYDRTYAWLLLAIIQYFHGQEGASDTWREAMRLILENDYACLIDKTGGFAYQMFSESLSSKDSDEQKLAQTLLNSIKRIPVEPLQITTLGDFYIEQGGRRISSEELHLRRAGELLGLLLSQPNHQINQEKALEGLAPNEARTKQQTILYHATSTLRRLLEPNLPDKFPSRYLEVRNEQLNLILPPGSQVDYKLLREHHKNKHFDQALGIYGGEWMADYPYAEWALELREDLTRMYLECLNTRTQILLKNNNPSEALESCRRILALEPWNELAAQMAVEACLLIGDKAGAIRIFRNLVKALESELGLEPSPEIKQKISDIAVESRETA